MQVIQVPFLWVNVIAACAFILMFTVFLAAKKTPEIYAFLALLLCCVLWTGGTVLMRMQLWPGMRFWYTVSLMAIFSLEALFYTFLHFFSREKAKSTMFALLALTAALVPGTVSGFFLAAPVAVTQPNGTVVYLYESLGWPILVPLAVFVYAIVASLRLLARMQREQGAHASGVMLLFGGGVMLLVGNFLQIGLPGNTFPFDTLAGLGFALLIIFALYRRRLFRMTLVISRSLLMVAAASICMLFNAYIISPLYAFALEQLRLSEGSTIMLLTVVLALLLSGCCWLLQKLINTLFTREAQQNRLLKGFSADVVQTLSTGDVMSKLTHVILQEVPASRVYICLSAPGGFALSYTSDPLAGGNFTIDAESPKVRYLQEQNECLLTSEFSAMPQAISDWAAEKDLFRRLEIDCMAAMRDGRQIVGLVLLSARDHARAFSVDELSFLETVCSIASIAMKNAALYEKIFREARIDPLTGALNYRAFVSALDAEFRAHGRECLTLLYVDADDFKLYNQLYGVQEGDDALKRICAELTLTVGDNGTVYRSSGKVFAALLPGQDSRQAYVLAQELQRRVERINEAPERRQFKALTVSIGICAAPYAASTAKELMDNADMACYHAKQSGKNQVVVFRGSATPAAQSLGERTEAIVDQLERSGTGYSTTLSMLSALTAAIDAKDHYTYAHSKNVARYAANLAVAAGLNEDQVRTTYSAGLLHDIGKISVPEAILNKSEGLTAEEYQIMKDHVTNSIEMIRHLPEMDYLIPAVMGHHERWDGKGYPRGLAGEDIPLLARCLAVADVFDAMTTDRPYRKGKTLEYAVSELRRCAGVQLDPQLALLFAQLVEEGRIPLYLHQNDTPAPPDERHGLH